MLRHRGFTLLELLIVLSIAALMTVGASLALPSGAERQLGQEAQRLVTRLETARARSRASGQPIVALVDEHGMQFSGGAVDNSLSGDWLHAQTSARPVQLLLGPEPVIAVQGVQLLGPESRSLWVATDGVRPFTIGDAP